MENAQLRVTPQVRLHSWSNRILILAIAGILFLTLYPFRFNFHGAAARGITIPFFLGKGLKSVGSFDDFLNILLFVPFGFGLTEKLRERGTSRGVALAIALIAGTLFSYGIEFLQIYIPERDSGWEDVFTNATGSAVGCLLFQLCGGMVQRILAACEQGLSALLMGWRVVFVFVLYFGIWFTVSTFLQKATQLSNWKSDALLVVGNDATGRNNWIGQIRLLQIWDRAISSGAVRELFESGSSGVHDSSLRSYYDFSSQPPYHDEQNFLPNLDWAPQNPVPSGAGPGPVVFDGLSWLSSRVAVPALAEDLGKSNQFSVRVICTPALGIGANGRILSVSEPSGVANLTLRQEDTNLVFWFRNGLSARRSSLIWNLPNVFAASQTRDIVYTYDGSNLSLYIDGKRQPVRYRFGPGTALVTFLRKAKLGELNGYEYIYYALVFFPAGTLLGIAAMRFRPGPSLGFVACIVMVLLTPLVLEAILARVSGSFFSGSRLALSFVFFVAGAVWINMDREPIWNTE